MKANVSSNVPIVIRMQVESCKYHKKVDSETIDAQHEIGSVFCGENRVRMVHGKQRKGTRFSEVDTKKSEKLTQVSERSATIDSLWNDHFWLLLNR
jgi:hypothetical protein